jgi:hypothetical protein
VLVAAQKEAVKNAVYASKLNAANMIAGAGETLGKLLYIDSYMNDYLQPGGGSLQVVRASATGTYEIVRYMAGLWVCGACNVLAVYVDLSALNENVRAYVRAL